MTKIQSEETTLVSAAHPNAAFRTPVTPHMVVPKIAWRKLCARTGGGIALGTFYRWIRSGRVYSVRMGNKILVPVQSLDKLVEHCLTGDKL